MERVNIEQLIYENNIDHNHSSESTYLHCVMCQNVQNPGILLNNRAYLCQSCIEKISGISYPEKYEYLLKSYKQRYQTWRAEQELLIEKINRHVSRKKLEWIQGRCEFKSNSPYTGVPTLFWIATAIFLLLSLSIPLIGLAGTVFCFISAKKISDLDSNRMMMWEIKHPKPDIIKFDFSMEIPEWDTEHPEPQQPIMRHFHDPSAELSQQDRTVLYVFRHWPDYPPFWDALKQFVINRDENRCQVTGCPSRVSIQVHHKKPISQGGEHTPNNLVCLCAFHHGLEPDIGHERVWGDIKNRYFTMVRAHQRKNRSGNGYHPVRAHVRRLELVTAENIKSLAKFYGFCCPVCDSKNIKFTLKRSIEEIEVLCKSCGSTWTAKRALAEENGPRLAEVLKPTKNIGRYKANWQMFEMRNEAVFKNKHIKKHRDGSIKSNIS
ncbi:MAG: HNH endonuclease [candidate division KSB1 bacterium]|nr:HNH endonuclease [candidate division KSB1 bacterium]